jgi:predicted CoA-substrate-specific enzyme activase
MENARKSLGVCIGASAIKAVELIAGDGGARVGRWENRRHDCNTRECLTDLLQAFDPAAYDYVCVTGRKFKDLVNLPAVTEPEAVESALRWLRGGQNEAGFAPSAFHALMSLGSESFILYELDDAGAIVGVRAGNKCASGTGEFFLQQIRRMDLSLDEASRLSAAVEPYTVSGRCSVFCKSDCTHALNKGIPRERVCAGLGNMIAEKALEILGSLPRENVLIVGGVTKNAYVVERLRQAIKNPVVPPHAEVFEALGAAVYAMEHQSARREPLALKPSGTSYSLLPPLCGASHLVTFQDHARGQAEPDDETVLGLDVGSTTTKAALVRVGDDKILASVYLRTNGNPIKASRECYREIGSQLHGTPVRIVALGVTGSGRHIAALHAQSDGIINEIIAHATAAAFFDKEVDTILEIGGQDAKYTHLVNGVPCDYAMNEACSAGTGSFLEEAAKESLNIDVLDIQEIALRAESPPNFNDQCAAFISSDIKNASHELSRDNIVAGLVYSIAMNYNNRVKGSRKVGTKIFMQGGVCYNRAVPLAMASLLGRQIVVPPEPGLMGAFGVALEAKRRLTMGLLQRGEFHLDQLAAREVAYGESFTCPGTKEKCDRGCVINVIELAGKSLPFGGICNKYYNRAHHIDIDPRPFDFVSKRQEALFAFAPSIESRNNNAGGPAKGNSVHLDQSASLPDVVLNENVTVHRPLGTGSFFGPFRRSSPARMKAEKSACPLAAEGDSPIFAADSGFSEEQVLAAAKIGTVPCERLHEKKPAGVTQTVALSRSFLTHLLYPLYARFFSALGFEIVLSDAVDPEGVRRTCASFCYPAELAHGWMQNLLRKEPDYIFLPQVCELHVEKSPDRFPGHQCTCVALQAEPYYLRSAFKDIRCTVLSPTLNFSRGWDAMKDEFVRMGRQLGRAPRAAAEAYRLAVEELKVFLRARRDLGRSALDELRQNPDRLGIVLFGRPYNAFASEANMGIPRKFASRGAYCIPFDCLPFLQEPSWDKMTWAIGHDLMRAARFVKNHPRLFGAFVTNFSCGPDSFVVGYFREIMGTKPSLTLEIDSHTADAGVNTRVEAFLDIIDRYRKLRIGDPPRPPFRRAYVDSANGASALVASDGKRYRLKDPRVKVLMPSMGRTISELSCAALTGVGMRAEAVPLPDFQTLMLGRGNTSCKECLPLILTTGSLLEYLQQRRENGELLLYFMPTSNGNCRFSQYHVYLNGLIEKKQIENVATFTLTTADGYGGLGAANVAKIYKSLVVADLMDDIHNALRALAVDGREAEEAYEREMRLLVDCLQNGCKGLYPLLRQSAERLAAIRLKQPLERAKRVLLSGEIFVRKDEFSSQAVVDALARRQIVALRAPMLEWLRFVDYRAQYIDSRKLSPTDRFRLKVRALVFSRIERNIKRIMVRSGLCSSDMVDLESIMNYGEYFVPKQFGGETILAVGRFFKDILRDFHGMISIGPFACLPTRIIQSILTPESKIKDNRRVAAMPGGARLQQYVSLPFLSVECDGNPFPQIIEAQLEAFCLQVERLHGDSTSMRELRSKQVVIDNGHIDPTQPGQQKTTTANMRHYADKP